ncbi:MAG: flagellar type III secretion system pore protein FliP [Defluviitaleaceae bacterium]|nr:flagellar type III secretion system pore protein FliP [Defluviitaleaceae bacterium]
MNKRILVLVFATLLLGLFFVPETAYAQGLLSDDATFFPGVSFEVGATDDPEAVVATLQVLFLVSIIALAPSLLVLLTSFLRIIIVLSFTRQAMATQQMPPNQVLVGIALFLTLFVMAPQFTAINENAIQPLGTGDINIEQAIDEAYAPLRDFMYHQLNNNAFGSDAVALFMDLGGVEVDFESGEHIPANVLIPAFIVNELMMGFFMGFMIYLPFIVIDMVVASVLMSMGMMMLPPAMISMPFKIMVFLLAGGWELIIVSTLQTFW